LVCQVATTMSVVSCNRQSKIYNLKLIPDGVLAQLVERLNGIEEVTGSNPVGSIFLLAVSSLGKPSCQRSDRVTAR
jgi:hypothetical protein